MTYDAALWGALACALTALGGVGSYAAWRRRGAAAGLRGLAWSLLPVAAWLTGTLRLLTDVLGDIGRWAVHLVFSPLVWLGVCVAGVSVVLFGVSGLLRGRRTARERTPGAPAGRTGSTPPRRAVGRSGRASKAGTPVDDDLSDVEEILRKHGIS